MYDRIPILEALTSHVTANPLPLHVPGHKMGRGFAVQLAVWMGQALRLDLTELPGLDDLHQPEGPIAEAQQLAAEAFGSDMTYFLVGGSTVGNLAMILTVCAAGDTVILPRNAHKSVHNAVMLAGARPVYLYPQVDEQFGIPTVVPVKEVERALQEHPAARAVLITNPTYQGVCSDVAAIADVVHRHGKLLLVDEAHGAHFSFHTKLPPAAIQSGADLAVQSTHKMLGSLTGTAMLHGKGNRYDRERLKMMLQAVQTSSPSYLMLLSLDAARHQMQMQGTELLQRAIDDLAEGRAEITKLKEIKMYGGDQVFAIDPFKWWIQVESLGLSGWEADRILREHRGIYCEMGDDRHLLAVFSYADTGKQIGRFLQGLRYLTENHKSNALLENKMDSTVYGGFRLEQALLPRELSGRERSTVKLENAAGWIAAEAVIPYPPGIPLILPGERYSTELIEHLTLLRRSGARFQGAEDPALQFVRVVV
ncbi:aminotransferase class I/II-fold pyridoxal phosphate-dependent enzyme [Effusibacillus dendaii]|uniref:Arginine decarboxylase n=1 Tax=Effusibacillus dendaii TaxID=2743772 RepID=A0A7I8DFU2_9BACL|nr:aminotransferase class I/II-fold pyridoxal phosphate-dependent enzyme [Effusibacillus dendaii]BCJ87440.1 arginine decarboxylase [Effusibacillus dendaii]